MIHLLLPVLAPFSGEFTLHRAMDPTTGKVAMRYFLPRGWKAVDNIEWAPGNRMQPMAVSSKLTSPDGGMEISILPSQTTMFQVQNGQVQGTLPPETATKVLDAVLSNQHPSVQNAHLGVRKDFEIPTPLDGQAGLKTKGFVGILGVSFQENGQPMNELMSVTEYEGSHQGDDGLVQGVTMLTQGYTLTCKGDLTDAAYRTFALVIASNRPDPTFFGTVMEVSKAQQSGTPDVKKVASGVKGLPDDAKQQYVMNLSLHGQSTAKIVPPNVYPGLTEVTTFEGSIMTFKGIHVWMKKPDEYFISDSANGPSGPGWQEAKAAS